jgi:hypothetical protein
MKWAVPTSVQNIVGAHFMTDIDADVPAVTDSERSSKNPDVSWENLEMNNGEC